jgi:hypothetical protein
MPLPPAVQGDSQILSGSPRSCLGGYGPDQGTPGLGYSNACHWCNGEPFAPGKTHNPWTYMLSLSGEYRPEWADRKLGFNVMVYNVLNKQEVTQTHAAYGNSTTASSLDPDYLLPYTTQPPRYVRFGVTYDF